MKDKIFTAIIIVLISLGVVAVVSIIVFLVNPSVNRDKRIDELNKEIRIRELEIKLKELKDE